MSQPTDQPVSTTRGAVLGQVLVCDGCCCGREERGYPAVPRQWLKTEWKARKLNRHIQLTISGCLGPCDVANVVAILTPRDCTWLGGLSRQDQYEALFDWVQASAELGELQPLPPALQAHVFRRFDAPVAVAPCGTAEAADR